MEVDAIYAWPTAKLRVIEVEKAARMIYQKEIAAANPDNRIKAKIEELEQKFPEPYHSASILAYDDIIDPRDTRPTLIKTLNRLSRKLELESPRPKRKHGLIPV